MAFDPYSEWLHIPADRRPPTWYDLLGLTPGESDPEAISRAVQERYDRVRNYASGPLGDQANRILDELAEARRTLTDREKKFRYDASLLGATAIPSPLGAAVTVPVADSLLVSAPLAAKPAGSGLSSDPGPLPGPTQPKLQLPRAEVSKREGGEEFSVPRAWMVGGGAVAALVLLLLLLATRGGKKTESEETAADPQTVVPATEASQAVDAVSGAVATVTPSPPPPPPSPPISVPPLVNSVGMNLVWIPPGEIQARTRAGGQVDRRLPISRGFYLGVREVAWREYQQVLDEDRGTASRSGRRARNAPPETMPVQTDWAQAVEFCRKLSARPEERDAGRVYRLPSEDQWEYACLAGSRGPYCFGDQADLLPEYASYAEGAPQATSTALGGFRAGEALQPRDVGGRKPNRWGLFDMHGNVPEWTTDAMGGPLEYRVESGFMVVVKAVARGGGYSDAAEGVSAYARSVVELGAPPRTGPKPGFRVLCELRWPDGKRPAVQTESAGLGPANTYLLSASADRRRAIGRSGDALLLLNLGTTLPGTPLVSPLRAAYGQGIVAAAVSPDGRLVAASGPLGLWLWNSNDLKKPARGLSLAELAVSPVAEGSVRADRPTLASPQWLEFSSDGELLMGGPPVRIWRVATLRQVAEFPRFARVLAVSEDGRRLACGPHESPYGPGYRTSAATAGAICDLVRGNEVCPLPLLRTARFTSNGRYLLGLQGRVLQLIDASRGAVLREFPFGPVTEERWQASRGSWNETDSAPGIPLPTPPAVSKDGQLAAIGLTDGAVAVLSLEGQREVTRIYPGTALPCQLEFLDDGRSLAVWTADPRSSSITSRGYAGSYPVASGRFTPHDAAATRCVIQWPDGAAMLAGDGATLAGPSPHAQRPALPALDLQPEKSVLAKDAASQLPEGRLPGSGPLVEVRAFSVTTPPVPEADSSLATFRTIGLRARTSLTILPDGQSALISGDGRPTTRVDLSSGRTLQTFSEAGPTAGPGWSDGREIRVVGESSLGKWELAKGVYQGEVALRVGHGFRQPAGVQGSVVSAAWSGDGQSVAIVGRGPGPSGGTPSLFYLEVPRFRMPVAKTTSSTPSKRSASGSRSRSAKELIYRGPVKSLATGSPRAFSVVAVMPDGRSVLAADVAGQIAVVDTRTARLVRSFEAAHSALRTYEEDDSRLRGSVGLPDPVSAIAVSLDGQLAVSAGRSDGLRVWEVSSGKQLKHLPGRAACVDLSWDGRWALSASGRSLSLWKVDEGEEQARVWLDGAAQAVRFSPDGRHAISLSLLSETERSASFGSLGATDNSGPVRRVQIWQVGVAVAPAPKPSSPGATPAKEAAEAPAEDEPTEE